MKFKNFLTISIICVFATILFIHVGFNINDTYFHKDYIPAEEGYYDYKVYITPYGECYHSENCSYINRKSEIALLKAINKGYRKCSHCHGTSSEKMWVEGVEEQKEKNNYILSFTISFIIIWGIAASIIINYIISVRKQEKSLP